MKRPRRPDGCLSDFTLDRLLAGELAGEDAVLEHVRTCGDCGAREAALRAARDAFARDAPPLTLGRSPRRRGPALVFAVTSALAAAAALLLFINSRDDASGTRTKGGHERLSFFVKHGDTVRLGGTGDRVEPGDAVRFAYSTAEARQLAVFSLDGAGHASVYFPPGSTSVEIAPGTDVALPSSTVLDEVLGRETIYGVFCPRTFELEPVRRALETTGEVPTTEGCHVERLSFEKRSDQR